MERPRTPDRAARTLERLELLAQIGREPGQSGSTRPGLSRLEQRAHDQVAEWLEAEGLTVWVDAAGNTFGRLEGSDPGAPEIWAGSHLDSVPDAGRFDGVLGVLCALEAIAARADDPRRATLCVVAFRDEEGWRFSDGCFGSRAVCGRVTADDLDDRDAAGVSIAEALAELSLAGAPFGGPLPGTFIELHVEQGPVLERAETAIGIVTAIAGMTGFVVEFGGEAGHAGTVPMAGRHDAFAAAAAFALRLYETALALPSAVATVGDARILNPASNVVPGRVRMTVDVRAQDADALERLRRAVEQLAAQEADRFGCSVELAANGGSPPQPMSARVRAAIGRAASERGITAIELPSGAGHDAGVLARAGVESGMIFVRSLNGGASHRPEELSSRHDIQQGIDVLAGTLAALERESP